eukprot:6057638-Pyramimonas_sp.AAC.1
MQHHIASHPVVLSLPYMLDNTRTHLRTNLGSLNGLFLRHAGAAPDIGDTSGSSTRGTLCPHSYAACQKHHRASAHLCKWRFWCLYMFGAWSLRIGSESKTIVCNLCHPVHQFPCFFLGWAPRPDVLGSSSVRTTGTRSPSTAAC